MTEESPAYLPAKRGRGSYERTVEAILTYAEQNGTLPSARKVREIRGNGSLTDIAEHIRRFCSELVERTRGAVPAGIPEEAVEPVRKLMEVIRAQERAAADERTAAATSAAEDAERARQAAQQELERAQAALVEARGEIQQLEARMQELEAARDTKADELAEVNRRFSAALEQARLTESGLREQIDAAQKLAAEAQEAAREADYARKAAISELKAAENRAREATKANDAAQEKLAAFRADRENIIGERDRALDEANVLREQLLAAQAKIDRDKRRRIGRKNRPLFEGVNDD